MEKEALKLLQLMLGPEAHFRKGQLEAIKAVLTHKKVLLVQKTGWGKSIIYFILARMLRDKGAGPTLLISPLLALMRNQVETANRIGIRAETINSSNREHWNTIKAELSRDSCDILLLSPERLGNQEFMKEFFPLINSRAGMLVVDEAHCISDWGHDFRPDYLRITEIARGLPTGIPLLGTTATANDRVIADMKKQLGEKLLVLRGELIRESLSLQAIKMEDKARRLAWLAENLEQIQGAGIIYCLTVNDCEEVSGWLRERGYDVFPYHSRLSSEKRKEYEQRLINNDIKALVATVALGMGFDKSDIRFIIHYQRSGNIIQYYQQIGRAGRDLKRAVVILLNGKEDDDIQMFFIEKSISSLDIMEDIIKQLEKQDKGLSVYNLVKQLNTARSRLERSLKILEVEDVIAREGSRYILTAKNKEQKAVIARYKRIIRMKYRELKRMKEFVKTDKCLMKYIAEELDDPRARDCGKCANCRGKPLFSEGVNVKMIKAAERYLNGEYLSIKPRKSWPFFWKGPEGSKIPKSYQNEEGLALFRYGDGYLGELVKKDKYISGYFRDELLEAVINLIRKQGLKAKVNWITAVPSLRRPELVRDFAKRLASRLDLRYIKAIKKIEERPVQQKIRANHKKALNVYGSFEVSEGLPAGSVLLIDDIADSRWTLTVCGYLLRKKGSGPVYPLVLALSEGQTKMEGKGSHLFNGCR